MVCLKCNSDMDVPDKKIGIYLTCPHCAAVFVLAYDGEAWRLRYQQQSSASMIKTLEEIRHA